MKRGSSFTVVSILFFLFISILGCKKGGNKYIYTNKECFNLKKDSTYLTSNIIGNWKWIEEYTYNQITGEKVIITPQSEGYSKLIIFNSSGRCYFYKNLILTNEYNYKITRLLVYTKYYLDSTFVLGYHRISDNGYATYNFIKPCNDTLILYPKYDYAPTQTFIRN